MKRTNTLIGFLLAGISMGFTKGAPNPTPAAYNFFYIDNSRTQDNAPVNLAMIHYMGELLDTIASTKGTLSYYISNDTRPETGSTLAAARESMSSLMNSYMSAPDSWRDRTWVNDRLSHDANLQKATSVNLYLFLSEAYLKNDLLNLSSGVLLNFLPKEIQAYSNCSDDRVHVYIIYPEKSKPGLESRMNTVVHFGQNNKDFASRIQYHFMSL